MYLLIDLLGKNLRAATDNLTKWMENMVDHKVHA